MQKINTSFQPLHLSPGVDFMPMTTQEVSCLKKASQRASLKEDVKELLSQLECSNADKETVGELTCILEDLKRIESQRMNSVLQELAEYEKKYPHLV